MYILLRRHKQICLFKIQTFLQKEFYIFWKTFLMAQRILKEKEIWIIKSQIFD